MYAIVSREEIKLPPGTVMQMPGTWSDYCALCESRGDGSIPRLKFCQGEIFLMSPLPRHGREAHLLGRIVEVLLDRDQRDYEAFTPITMTLPERYGIEPDYCFYIENWSAVIGKDRLDWQVDPPPDLVIEIDVTNYTAANDYLPYKVPEVWLLKKGKLNIYQLQNNCYQSTFKSQTFPNFNLPQLTTQVLKTASQKGSSVALRELREELLQ